MYILRDVIAEFVQDGLEESVGWSRNNRAINNTIMALLIATVCISNVCIEPITEQLVIYRQWMPSPKIELFDQSSFLLINGHLVTKTDAITQYVLECMKLYSFLASACW